MPSNERATVIRRETTYAYRDGRPLTADLYLPGGSGPFPGVIEVHGGAWCTGDRGSDAPLNTSLAERGIVVMAIDFRMPPVHRYPCSIQDVTTAIDWLRAHATDLRVAGDVGAVGTSSGGHQVALAALCPDRPEYRAELLPDRPRPALRYAVLCWPVVDPVARYLWAESTGITRLVERHRQYWSSVAQMADGSPHIAVLEGRASHRPALLVVQGEEDENLPRRMLGDFERAYRTAGGDIAVRVFANMTHNFIMRDPAGAAAQQAVEDIAAFIHRASGVRREDEDEDEDT